MGLSLILGLIPTIFPQIMDLVKRFVPDPSAQAQLQIEIAKIQAETASKQAEAQNAIFEEQGKVMQADAGSESALTRNARPIIALGFASTIGVTFLFAIIDALLGTHSVAVLTDAMQAIPDKVLNTVLTLVGGWSALRTVEKVATTVAKK